MAGSEPKKGEVQEYGRRIEDGQNADRIIEKQQSKYNANKAQRDAKWKDTVHASDETGRQWGRSTQVNAKNEKHRNTLARTGKRHKSNAYAIQIEKHETRGRRTPWVPRNRSAKKWARGMNREKTSRTDDGAGQRRQRTRALSIANNRKTHVPP
jgi:hypothetical protein